MSREETILFQEAMFQVSIDHKLLLSGIHIGYWLHFLLYAFFRWWIIILRELLHCDAHTLEENTPMLVLFS
jgi:hypothetical protein